MSATAIGQMTSRHPWLDVFAADPVKGFGELLAGYPSIYPYSRADAPDAARMLFGSLPADDPAREALSSGALGWLNEQRRTPLPADPAALQDRIRAVSEALEIIALLNVAEAAAALRHEYPRWAEWSQHMVLAPSRDARSAYWRMLAQTQTIAAPRVTNRVTNRDALAPLWMRICREAGGDLPERYLQIGLLGLRRLPEAIERGDVPWIAGLAAWAMARNPSEKQFLRVWKPFKRLYPTPPSTLRKLVFNLLAQKPYRNAGIEPPGWWAADPDFLKAQAKGSSTRLEPPPREMLENILKDIKDRVGFAKLKPGLDKLLRGHRIYAERSGDSDFLIRTFCNVGMRLIRHGEDACTDRARFAQGLAREVLNHHPSNVFAWPLWRDALAAEGALEAARALGWEMVRRFPEDPNSRSQLADLLAKEIGALSAAEAVVREAITRFPADAYGRTVLAELLIAQDRTPEAQAVVEAALHDGTLDATATTYNVLARLRFAAGDFDGAQWAIETGLRLEPNDIHLLGARAKLRQGEALPLVSAAYRRAEESCDTNTDDDSMQDDLLRSGRLRALRDRLSRDAGALDELKSILAEDPTFAYAQLLAARHRLWQAEEGTLPPVAVAFEAALADEDRARLEALAERAPRLEALILLARALLGDAEAAQRAAELLNAEDKAYSSDALRILRERLKPVLIVIRGGAEPHSAFLADSNRVRQAIYDVNEALSAPEIIAA